MTLPIFSLVLFRLNMAVRVVTQQSKLASALEPSPSLAEL